MARLPVLYPLAGLSESFALSEQPIRTSRAEFNARTIDPTTMRVRGGQRAGTKRYGGDNAPISAGNPGRFMTALSYPTPNQTYASLGNSLTIDQSVTNTVSGDTLGVRTGTQGDIYSIDGNTGILKTNADGATVWKIALAPEDKDHQVRALYIDGGTPDNRGTDLVLAGVSLGGSSLRAKFWAYIQKDDAKTEKLWELSVKGFVEAFRIKDNTLYVLANFPDKNAAYVIVYQDYLTVTPTEVRRWRVPYPANDMDVSPKDSTIFTASDANTRRDVNPDSPKGTFASVDWTLEDLPFKPSRLWAWLDASDISTLSIEPRQVLTTATSGPPGSSTELDGGNVRMWLDKSGHGRNLYQTVDGNGISGEVSRCAIFRAKGINGMPSLHFDGKTCGMISEEAGTDDKANRFENLSLLPMYKGAQFVMCMVIRASAEDTIRRGLLGCGTTSGFRYIGINERVSNNTGSNLVPGQIRLREDSCTASDTSASSPAAAGPSGANSNPLGHGLPDSGFAVVTWICDGRVHDVFGTATRSTFRVNGIPCDRWQSAAFNRAEAVTLGYVRNNAQSGFVGEVAEIVVLSDWYDTNDAIQRLAGGTPTSSYGYPDGNWASGSDTELERIEGYLAHKWGIAHELCGGRADYLTISTLPVDGDTVTIDGTVYRFKNVLAQAYDVLIGASIDADATPAVVGSNTAVNLYRAINGIGTPGVEYHALTVAHTTYRASAPVSFDATGTSFAILIRSRNAFAAAANVAESTATVRMSWAAATTQTSINGSGANLGWYPHPFYLEKTSTTAGGPPRTAGASTVSKYWAVRSQYPILSAWDPANGKLRDVLTSNYDGTGVGVGGVGYGAIVASTGEVYSCGPRQAAVVSPLPAILADAIDIRKIIWTQQTFSIASSATSDAWAFGSASTPASPGALGYAYPRMAVDKYDNLYVPYFNTTGGNNVSLLAFKKASTGAAAYNPVALFSYSGLTDHNEAYAVAVDPTYPTIPAASTVRQAEFVVLATRIESSPTTKATIFRLKAVSTTNTNTPSRSVIGVAVAGGDVKSFTSTAVTLIASSGLDVNARYIDGVVLLGKLYLTDGKSYKVYDPVAGTFGNYTSSVSGKIPPRCAIISTHRDRIVLTGCADNVAAWFMSKQGSPRDFDMAPYTITAIQAANGVDARAGTPPDKVNSWVPYSDDLSFIGCDSSIWRMTGDPTPEGGGEIHNVSTGVGMAWGRCWCIDPHGILYFFGSRGGVYRMSALGSPEPISAEREASTGLWRSKIEQRLRGIDLSLYRIELQWNADDIGLHVFVCPYGNGGAIVEHYFWCAETGSWHPDKWRSAAIQPTTSCVFDGDLPDDRKVLFIGEDGIIRRFDPDSKGDDTVPSTMIANYAIDSSVLIGPLAGSESGREVMFSQLECLMANDQAGPWAKLYVTDRPDVLGDPVWQGKLSPGRSPRMNGKFRGAFVFIELRLFDPRARWAFEHMAFNDVRDMGLVRSQTA